MRKIFLIASAVLLVTGLASRASAITADSLFAVANRQYDNKDYGKALDSYLRLEKNDMISAALYYNIGNCYFKQNKLGYAILYYLRAKRLKPNDNDINANLAFARQFMPTRLEGVRINPVTTFLDSMVAPFTINGIAWVSSALFILFILFLCAAVFLAWHGFWVKLAGYLLLIILLIFSGLTTYKYRTDYMVKKGVIVTDQAQIYSGPGEDNDLEFVGAYGLTFQIEKSTDKYYLAIFENQRRGWISKGSAEVI
ncbi:conserved membrane hypothetical protein [Candidatus Zixiibacteriota bacterium]|nr:conserved membrane hypothetical protein [candidate division Zixibacteria bacterium]